MRAPKNTTERNRQEIVLRFLNGDTQKCIARTFGLDRTSVSKRLRRWGFRAQDGLAARAVIETTATQLELAYVAGIIDGEGCICISHGSKSRSPSPAARFGLAVSVGMTDTTIVRQLGRWFGGNVSHLRKHKKKAYFKDALKWQLPGVKAAVFLQMIMPYLRVKRRQAKIAIAFAKTLIYKGHKPPNSLYETRYGYWLAMRNDPAKAAKAVLATA